MPEIIEQRSNLELTGAVFRFHITVPQDITSEVKPLDIAALIDTGAHSTVIQTGIAAKLGLPPTRPVKIQSAKYPEFRSHMYRIRLLLAPGVDIEVEAMEAPMRGYYYECLIGRDVLKHCMLFYDGKTNSFALHF
jgi:predicted aspartyl protease